MQDELMSAEGEVKMTAGGMDAHRHITLMDICNYGRTGLAAVFNDSLFIGSVTAAASLEDAFSTMPRSAKHGETIRHLVIRLPTTSREALLVLLQLESEEDYLSIYHGVTIISSFEPPIVQRMITALGMEGAHVVDARLSVLNLYRAILPVNGHEEETRLHRPAPPRLTPSERKALYHSLMNWPIHLQARSRGVSPKTIYTQRSGALRKFGVADILSLLRYLTLKVR